MPPLLPTGLWPGEAELEALLQNYLERLPPSQQERLRDPATPLAPLGFLLRPLLEELALRLDAAGISPPRPAPTAPPPVQPLAPLLPPPAFRGRWLRRLARRLRRGPGPLALRAPALELGELLLLGGLLACALTRLGFQYPRRPGGRRGENASLGASLELLDRHFRLRPGWFIRLDLEPLLAAAGEPWWQASPSTTIAAALPPPPPQPWQRRLGELLAAAGGGPELAGALALLARWGLRPHYPSEAALLEPFPSYRQPPPLAPLGEGLLGLLLDPLDQWGLEQQQQLQRGEQRRQNPTYSRLLYLRRRMAAEGWQRLPPAAAGWRPHPGEVGLSRGDLQRQLSLLPSRDSRDPDFRRHRYLRHGSLLLLGVAAPATQARCWAQRLAAEASAACGQSLAPPRLRSSSAPLPFRGFWLRCAPLGAGGVAAPPRGRRRCTPRLGLRLPTSRLAALLGHWGLLSWGGEGIRLGDLLEGRSPHGWHSGVNRSLLRHSSNRLLRAFGEALATTAAYYRGVDNAPQLLRLLRRLRGTLLRTLACRYRLPGHQLEGR